MYDLAVIGIGRVGLPLALIFAREGMKVVGVDCNEEIIKSVRQAKMPFFETGCQELLDEGVRFETTQDIEEINDGFLHELWSDR